jgi:hypothetical protein
LIIASEVETTARDCARALSAASARASEIAKLRRAQSGDLGSGI